MDDLISRQAAIDAIEEYSDRLQMVNWQENPGVPYKAYALNWAVNTIRDLPSAHPEQRWILCSERLPKDKDYDETFIVTIQCEHVDGWDDYVTGYADWTPHGWDIQSYYMGQIKVTAWMPLPAPWKGEADGQN